MRRILLAAGALFGLLAAPMLLLPPAADAHPLGNFTINRYARIDLTPGIARIRYVIDMAEIPTFQERDAIDTNRDGTFSDEERSAYLTRQAEAFRANLTLAVDGGPIALRVVAQEISFPPGQGGLDLTRFALWLEGSLPRVAGATSAEWRDDNYSDRLGWKEIIVRGGPGTDVTESTVLNRDTSNELRSYPADLLKSPLNQREARFRFAPGVGMELTDTGPSGTVASPSLRKSDGKFAQLITRDVTLPVLLLSLVVAMGLGALHALGPGHGKTVVAAYLVGSRGTTKHAIFLGTTVTLTHTSSVFAVGLVTLYLSEFILPETLMPWLSFISGATIAAMGAALLVSRAKGALRRRGRSGFSAALEPATAHSRMRQYAPEHTHGGATFRQPHRHGGSAHSHLPPGAQGERVTWRSLLALGISGGILPCPAALVVLLTAFSIGRIGYGMLLILSFSIGLAVVLTAIGLLLVHARSLFSRVPFDSTIARFAPLVSALVVIVLGVGIAYRAVTGTGFML